MSMSEEINFILTFICLFSLGIGEFMYEPSFISDWYEVQAGQESSSSLDIPHNLGEYPVKVEVQVMIVEGGNEYIFSGIGSSQRDDDLPDMYGAVIYRYNDSHVQIGLPFRHNAYNNNFGLAYTGAGTLYDGPSSPVGPYVNGTVRVRAWLATDMPEPVFNMSTQINNAENNYRELTHGLGSFPDIVTVQTKMDDGYMSDGIGVVFFDQFASKFHEVGGVLFGYDHEKVRLWTPYDMRKGKVFMGDDGYSLGEKNSGTAFVIGWKITKSQHVFFSGQDVMGTISHTSVVTIPGSFDLQSYLVSVKYELRYSSRPTANNGMQFYAAGTTQASIKAGYGGIVYAYTKQSVLLWKPKSTIIVNIGGIWGNNSKGQQDDMAGVSIEVYYLKEHMCPWPDIPVNATLISSGQKYGDTLNYTCNTDHVLMGGDLLRSCGRMRQWSGSPPNCIDKRRLTESSCYNTNRLTDTELQEMLQNMKVDMKKTSAYVRTKTSAADDRSSAKTIGLAGAFLLTSVFGFIVIPDLVSVFRYFLYLIKKEK